MKSRQNHRSEDIGKLIQPKFGEDSRKEKKLNEKGLFLDNSNGWL